MQELENWKKAEEEKVIEIKRKAIVEKNMRDEQLAEEKKAREEEEYYYTFF